MMPGKRSRGLRTLERTARAPPEDLLMPPGNQGEVPLDFLRLRAFELCVGHWKAVGAIPTVMFHPCVCTPFARSVPRDTPFTTLYAPRIYREAFNGRPVSPRRHWVSRIYSVGTDMLRTEDRQGGAVRLPYATISVAHDSQLCRGVKLVSSLHRITYVAHLCFGGPVVPSLNSSIACSGGAGRSGLYAPCDPLDSPCVVWRRRPCSWPLCAPPPIRGMPTMKLIFHGV